MRSLVAGWREHVDNHRQFILTSPEGHALYKVSDQVIKALDDEVARLTLALAEAQGTTVLRCLERDKLIMAAQAGDVPAGTILHATDTGRQWVLGAGGWEEQS